MYKIVICDDEQVIRDELKEFIKESFTNISSNIEIIEYHSGEELISNYPENVDIFLLDIQMGKVSGMDVAYEIRNREDDAEIIFITSLVDYIQEGYLVRAYRYLLKPLKYEDFKNNIEKCIEDLISKRENYLVIDIKGKVNKIPVSSIKYIDVMNKYITIHTLKEDYSFKTSLEKIYKDLYKYNFFKCHKSFIINMQYIDSIYNNYVIIDNTEIPVSKYRVSELKDKLAKVFGDILC